MKQPLIYGCNTNKIQHQYIAIGLKFDLSPEHMKTLLAFTAKEMDKLN